MFQLVSYLERSSQDVGIMRINLFFVGSYCVVFDAVIEDEPADLFAGRTWSPCDNQKTAVWEYLKSHFEFGSTKAFSTNP